MKGEQARDKMVKDMNGHIFRDGRRQGGKYKCQQMPAWHVADAISVWSWMNIVESST